MGARIWLPYQREIWRWSLGLAVLAATSCATRDLSTVFTNSAQFQDGTRVLTSTAVSPPSVVGKWTKMRRGSKTNAQCQHAYCIDTDTLAYTGYDLVVKAEGPGEYRVRVTPLSVPISQLSPIQQYDARHYREIRLPQTIVTRIVRENEAFIVPIAVHEEDLGSAFVRIKLSAAISESTLHRTFRWPSWH